MPGAKKIKTIQTKAISHAGNKWEVITVERNAVGDDDIELDIKYCGICHSDVHKVFDEFQPFVKTRYPCVPGHEIAGIAVKVGKNVTGIREGDKVGVGCIVDTCQGCQACKDGQEVYCFKGFTGTSNSPLNYGRVYTNTGYTLGGYTGKMVIHQNYAIRIPDKFPLEYAGPIFCSGITTYSPLAYWGALKGGMTIGVVGIGGLGQMAIAQAKAMGNTIVAISTSPHKRAMAMEMGASKFLISTDPEAMKAAAGSMNLILDTVSVDHDCTKFLGLLSYEGTVCMLGANKTVQQVMGHPLMFGRRSISGSCIGSIKETQDCIDFCHKHNIRPNAEFVTKEDLPTVYEKLQGKNDAGVKYVMDISKSLMD